MKYILYAVYAVSIVLCQAVFSDESLASSDSGENQQTDTVTGQSVAPAQGQDRDTDSSPANEVNYIPLVRLHYLNLEDQQADTLEANFIAYANNNPAAETGEKKEKFLALGFYKQYTISDIYLPEYADTYYDIALLFDKTSGKHTFFSAIQSTSDNPFSALRTYKVIQSYGHEIVDNQDFSFVLGGSILVGEITFPDNTTWSVIPLPFIRLHYTNSWLESSVEFLTGLNLEAVAGYATPLRLGLDISIDDYGSADDLFIDIFTEYRLFDEESSLGDFAGIRAGFRSEKQGFDLQDKDKDLYSFFYRSVYAALDLSVVHLSAGYAFDGKENYGTNRSRKVGDGYWGAARLAWQF